MKESKKSVVKVPNLRFPGFEGEWIETQLNKITKVYDGTHQTPKYVDEGVPFYSVEHISANQFEKTKFISEEVFLSEVKRVKISKGDILMTRIGSIGVSKYIDWNVRASFYVSLALIKSNSKFSSEFLNHYISTIFFQKELWKRTIHVAFPKKINLGEIGECNALLPSKKEQQKIADFITAIDEKIQTQNKIIEHLNSQLKNLSHKIFSQELRFKDENENIFPDWKEKELKNICSFYSGGTPKSTNKSFYLGNIPFVGSGNISDDSVENFITNEALTSSSAKLVEKGDLLYALYGATSGEVAISKISGAINQAVLCIKTNQNKDYLFYLLKYSKDRIVQTFIQGGQGNLSAKIVKELKFNFPNLEEQTKIASFLSLIDVKLKVEKTILKQLTVQKKYLLQELFI